MDENLTYRDCALKLIEEGYEPSRAAELCASERGRSEEEEERTRRDAGWDEYRGDD